MEAGIILLHDLQADCENQHNAGAQLSFFKANSKFVFGKSHFNHIIKNQQH